MKDQLKLIASEIIHKQNYVSRNNTEVNYQIQKDIKTDGCSFIENFLDEDTCARLRRIADEFILEHPEFVTLESNGNDKRVYKVDKYTDSFNLPAVDEIANDLFRDFSFIIKPDHFMLLGVINAGSDNLGSGGGWHRDSPFSHQFKTILYLSDVTLDNGPFQYIKGSHIYSSLNKSAKYLNKEISSRRFSEDEVKVLVDNQIVQNPTTFIGKAGSLLIADTRGLHRGSPLKSGNRYALTRYHFSKKMSDKFKI